MVYMTSTLWKKTDNADFRQMLDAEMYESELGTTTRKTESITPDKGASLLSSGQFGTQEFAVFPTSEESGWTRESVSIVYRLW